MAKLASPILLVVLYGLAGCTDASTSSGPGGATAQSLVDNFLKTQGANLDACFDGAPAFAGPGTPQTAPGPPARPVAINRLVVAVDSSGSMAARIGGETKLEAAKRAATSFLTGVPTGTQVGLVAFGHRGTNQESGKAASCAAVETLYPLGAADRDQVARAMKEFQAAGWTPLAAAITQAGSAFTPDEAPGAQVVYVVSDGIETCGGDPVAAARALNSGPVKAIVNVIGFDLAAADRAQLKAVADAGGGTFVETGPSELGRMLDDLRRKAGAVSAITRERFDAGGRTTDNNMAAGRYTTRVNYCLFKNTSAESAGLAQALGAPSIDPPTREAALELLRQRHERYRARAARVATDVDTRRVTANAAIDKQTGASETRLGQ